MSLMKDYSIEEFTRIVNESNSYSDCLRKLGYNSVSGDIVKTLTKYISDLKLDVSHFTKSTKRTERTEENIFIEDSTASQSTLRRWYKKGQYTEYKCAICGQEPIWNNKPMTLILDHINGNNHDNRLENLRWVCGNCNTQLETTNGKSSKRKEHKINHCIDCGIPISPNATRCLKCESKNRITEKPITREELKDLIRTTPFVQIGKQFGITDNGIRKWCKSYNLPTTKKEIKQYSDEEWELI